MQGLWEAERVLERSQVTGTLGCWFRPNPHLPNRRGRPNFPWPSSGGLREGAVPPWARLCLAVPCRALAPTGPPRWVATLT